MDIDSIDKKEEVVSEVIKWHVDKLARGVNTVVAYEDKVYDDLSGEELDMKKMIKARHA